jgi:hypothetical protein
MSETFYKIGKAKSDIQVRISYRIIQLFSEGLYSNPHKAIEELVSNSFDAGATNVHILLPPDLGAADATIAVMDDGVGMDEKGLRDHWLIGTSNKRHLAKTPKSRKQIGKFGIGKLASYVLARRLTHICKVGATYYSTSMDYASVPGGESSGIYTDEKVTLPLLILTEEQAKIAVDPWLTGSKPGYKAIKLFGQGAAQSWTLAIMSELKSMATDIQVRRLHWLLQSAMPLRDDFKLYLNGERVFSSKLTDARVGHWTLGKDLTQLPKPAPTNMQATEDAKAKKTSIQHFGLTHPQLGRVTGYFEVFVDPIDKGKSTEIERSNGFFVYVFGRLVNIEDAGFGINRNLLRHGTFSRFRMVVHIDRLDEELRSSRETFRAGPLVNIAQNILHGAFNYARVELERHEAKVVAGQQVASRIAASPGSLTRRPIVGLVRAALDGKYQPKYVLLPHLTGKQVMAEFLARLEENVEESEGFVQDVQLIEMSQEQVVARLDVDARVLQINTLHPFVAHFLDEYEDKRRSLPLELLAMSEVLLEAHLYEAGVGENLIQDVVSRRDEALRFLARSIGKRNARTVAQDLIDASTDKNGLQNMLVIAFDSMGFDAVPLGGPKKPDGLAEARLAGDLQGKAHHYKISLEAKSKEEVGKKVSAKTVGISAIARQRDDYDCDHALVAGPDFPTADGGESALVKEIANDRKASKKSITLIRISDLARLVRLVPLKRVGLGRIQDMLQTCVTPEECKAWIDKLAKESVQKVPYKNILEAIWGLQKERSDEAVEYSGLAVALQKGPEKLTISKVELIQICTNLSGMAPEMVAARKTSVELSQRPDKILAVIRSVIQEYPEEETKGMKI